LQGYSEIDTPADDESPCRPTTADWHRPSLRWRSTTEGEHYDYSDAAAAGSRQRDRLPDRDVPRRRKRRPLHSLARGRRALDARHEHRAPSPQTEHTTTHCIFDVSGPHGFAARLVTLAGCVGRGLQRLAVIALGRSGLAFGIPLGMGRAGIEPATLGLKVP